MPVPSNPLTEARFQVLFSDHIGKGARESILDEMGMDFGTERTPQTDGSYVLLVRKANRFTWVAEDLKRREMAGELHWHRLE